MSTCNVGFVHSFILSPYISSHFPSLSEHYADQTILETDTASGTLFLGTFLLLHGHKCRKVGLIIGEHQRRSVTLADRDLQGQIDSPKGNRSKCCRKPRSSSLRLCSYLESNPSTSLVPPFHSNFFNNSFLKSLINTSGFTMN